MSGWKENQNIKIFALAHLIGMKMTLKDFLKMMHALRMYE